MKGDEVIYRCGGCDTEFRVVSERRPRVICPECKVVATPSGDREALGAYQVGHARYQEARRQIGAGLKHYASGQLVDARALFDGASEDFKVAVEQFRSAANTADTAEIGDSAETALDKATCFWQGADWLSGATYAQEDDAPDRAQHFREEAEQKLLDAREHGTVAAPADLGAHTDASVPSESRARGEDDQATGSEGDTGSDRVSSGTAAQSDATPPDIEPEDAV
jgi:ribosomal protein S27E